MGFTSKKNSKVVTRDKISGFFIPTDVSVGEYGADDINKRVAAQQDAMNEGIVQDWENGFDEAGNPALGDALRREPRPSDYLNANDRPGATNRDRYGVAE